MLIINTLLAIKKPCKTHRFPKVKTNKTLVRLLFPFILTDLNILGKQLTKKDTIVKFKFEFALGRIASAVSVR